MPFGKERNSKDANERVLKVISQFNLLLRIIVKVLWHLTFPPRRRDEGKYNLF